MQVFNMTSPKGREVPNQFIIYTDTARRFQSYRTPIAEVRYGDGIYLAPGALNYSRTTSKYLYQFLKMNRADIERGLKDGTIKEAAL